MQGSKADMALLKQDLLKVLRRAFRDDSPQLEELAELMLPEPGQIATGPDFIMPEGQNVYAFCYHVRLKLHGDKLIRGRNVREATNNLRQELTQNISLRDLVAECQVESINPVGSIEIDEPELVHGIEPCSWFQPHAYMPRETRLMLGMDQFLDQLHAAIDSPNGISEQKAEAIINTLRELNKDSRDKKGAGPDLDMVTMNRLREVIRENPAMVRELLQEWEDKDPPAFIQDTLDDIEE